MESHLPLKAMGWDKTDQIWWLTHFKSSCDNGSDAEFEPPRENPGRGETRIHMGIRNNFNGDLVVLK